QGLALGDIRQRVRARSNDELGHTAAAFRRMIQYQSAMAQAAEGIARGDLSKDVVPASSDDVLGTAFRQTIEYLRRLAVAAEGIARGDLRGEVAQASGEDALGAAFGRMAGNLREVVGEVQRAAQGL